MRVDASTMGASLPVEGITCRGGAHHIRDFLKVAYVFSQVNKHVRGNLVRRPSITTPHSRISKRRRDVSPGRQLHEEEFGALPLTSVPKHATLSSRAGFLPLPPTRIASFGTGISRWDTTFPPRPPSTWAFPNPAAKSRNLALASPAQTPNSRISRKGAAALPQLTEPPNRNVVPGTGPQQPQTLTATALGGCPCR